MLLIFGIPRVSENYTNTPLWGLMLEERGAGRMLEDLPDTFPSAS